MQRKVVLIVVLILLCGVSAYIWMSNSEGESDSAIVKKSETYKCPSCGKDFDLTVAEATAMLRATRHEIVCPHCDAGMGGEARTGDVLSMSGGLPSGGSGDGNDVTDEEEEEAPPRVKGSMGPVDRP